MAIDETHHWTLNSDFVRRDVVAKYYAALVALEADRYQSDVMRMESYKRFYFASQNLLFELDCAYDWCDTVAETDLYADEWYPIFKAAANIIEPELIDGH